MQNQVDDYIMIQNLIPAQLCRSLIRESSLPDKKWSKHSWSSYGKKVPQASISEKELDIISSTEDQFKLLLKYLGPAVKNYQQKYSTITERARDNWINHITRVRFNRYKVGTKKQIHYDHIQTIFDGKRKGVPILSFVGLLNDNYKGGEFICREKEIKLKRGDILLFPSNFMFPHGVKEVTKGLRYSFVSWAF